MTIGTEDLGQVGSMKQYCLSPLVLILTFADITAPAGTIQHARVYGNRVCGYGMSCNRMGHRSALEFRVTPSE